MTAREPIDSIVVDARASDVPARPSGHCGVDVELSGSGLQLSKGGFLRALPVGIAGTVVGIVSLGVGGAAVAVLVVVPILFLAMTGVASVGRARLQRRAKASGAVFAAAASVDGVPGTVRVSRRALYWLPRGAREPVEIAFADILRVRIKPVRVLFLRAARVAVDGVDGRVLNLTVTAPAEDVRVAFRP